MLNFDASVVGHTHLTSKHHVVTIALVTGLRRASRRGHAWTAAGLDGPGPCCSSGRCLIRCHLLLCRPCELMTSDCGRLHHTPAGFVPRGQHLLEHAVVVHAGVSSTVKKSFHARGRGQGCVMYRGAWEAPLLRASIFQFPHHFFLNGGSNTRARCVATKC